MTDVQIQMQEARLLASLITRLQLNPSKEKRGQRLLIINYKLLRKVLNGEYLNMYHLGSSIKFQIIGHKFN